MKQLIMKLVVLLLIISSCTQDESYESPITQTMTDSTLSSLQLNVENGTWEKDLNYSLSGKGKSILLDQGLVMLGYELQENKVVLGKETVARRLSDNDLIPIYGDSLHLNNFNLLCVADIDAKYHVKAEDFYFEKKRNLINDYINGELKIVNIRWNYKGEDFETKCFVTAKSVIYDDILSNLRYITQEESSFAMIAPTTRLKTRTEPGSEGSSSISYTKMSSSLVCYTGTGKVGAIAYYYVQLVGTNDNGTKSIDYATYEAPHQSISGFYAVGKIEATKESLGKNGSFSYQFGIGVGMKDITLTWSGSSFTMYGQDQGSTGGESLTANSLN